MNQISVQPEPTAVIHLIGGYQLDTPILMEETDKSTSYKEESGSDSGSESDLDSHSGSDSRSESLPDNFVPHFVNFTLSLLLCYSLNFTKKI